MVGASHKDCLLCGSLFSFNFLINKKIYVFGFISYYYFGIYYY